MSTAGAQRLPVVLLSGIALLAIAAMGFVMPRSPGIEEATVFNAVFTYAQDGVMSFPVYGNAFLHSFGIHPHTHYGLLGLLMAAGANLYVAEGAVIVFSAGLILVLVHLGKWPDYIKVGFILGLALAVTLAVSIIPDSAFSVRPELHASLMFLAGLIALEGARIEFMPPWPKGRLFVGTFCVTLASTLQNFATLGFVAAGIYAVLLLTELRGSTARAKLALMASAGLSVGVPYLIFYVFPNWEMMQVNVLWGQNYAAPLALKWQQYFEVAKRSFSGLSGGADAAVLSWPIRASYALSLPLGLVTFALFLIHRSTRVLAFACLPPFVVIFFTLPKNHYFLAEYVLFLCAVWCAILYGLHGLAVSVLARDVPFFRAWRPWLLSGLATVLILIALPASTIGRTPFPPHEVTVARAAAQVIVNGHGVTASRHIAWYMTGANAWYRIESDLTEPASLCRHEIPKFLRQFDAIVDYFAFSDGTANGTTPSSLYADGLLFMKGFYIGQRLRAIDPVYLVADRPEQVTGFVMHNNVLERFQSDSNWDVVATTIVRKANQPLKGTASALVVRDVMRLPPGYRDGLDTVTILLISRDIWPRMVAALPPGAIVREAIEGRLSRHDARELVRRQQLSDGRISFIPYQQGGVAPLAPADGSSCRRK
jgi:hypothetical protein